MPSGLMLPWGMLMLSGGDAAVGGVGCRGCVGGVGNVADVEDAGWWWLLVWLVGTVSGVDWWR